jgi:hypothetical protein
MTVTRCANSFWKTEMRTALKRLVMWAYCREYICAATVTRIFARFGLKEH